MAQNNDNEFPLPTQNSDSQPVRRTSSHLPTFFRSDSNKKFLGGTLDPLTQPGKLSRINAYIGRKDVRNFVYPYDDNYVQENSTPRQYYQLEPAFIYEDPVNGDVKWHADYIDYINILKYFGANVSNHSKLNKQEAYAWNPHIDWDKFVNYRDYYWLPNGPDPVTIYGQLEATTSTYSVIAVDQVDNVGYVFSPDGLTVNPRLQLFRGIKYTFEINTPFKPFAIKTQPTPGSGFYYDIGVSARNVENGTVTFEIPYEAPDLLYYVDNNDANTFGMIEISNIEENTFLDVEKEILGKTYFRSSTGIDFINGLKLKFVGNVSPAKYSNGFWYVEGVGDKIRLVNSLDLQFPAIYGTDKDLPFDNQPFDSVPFDNASNYPDQKDYIVINRSSLDRNTWSRNNRWFHRDVIEKSALGNDTIALIDQNTNANRPIIEFEPDIKLFKHGYYSKTDIDLIDTVTTDVFSTIEGSVGYNIDGENIVSGYRILFIADKDILVNGRIFEVSRIFNANLNREQITLIEIPETDPLEGQNVYITKGKEFGGASFHYLNGVWSQSQEKTDINQAPLFDLFDEEKISYSDPVKYLNNTFAGNKIFNYKIGSGSNDQYLNFPIKYRNIDNIGDIEFEFDLQKGTWKYTLNDTLVDVYSYSGFLRKILPDHSFSFNNGWVRTDRDTEQNVVRVLIIESPTDLIPIDVFDNSASLSDLKIRLYVNDKKVNEFVYIDGIKTRNLSIEKIEGTSYIKLRNNLDVNDKVVYKVRSIANKNDKGYYEIPLNWQNNPLNNTVDNFTFGEVIDHVRTIVENVSDFNGDFPGTSNLSTLGHISQFGRKFLQHSGPMSLSSYLLVDKNVNIIRALQWVTKQYSIFKKEFLNLAQKTAFSGPTREIFDQILSKYSEGKNDEVSAFYFSDMAPWGAASIREYEVEDPRYPFFIIDSLYVPLSQTKRSILVYLNDNQLLFEKDYNFQNDDAFIIITTELKKGDKIVIKDYATTNGSYIPFTPSKLGIYPLFEPIKYLDDTYVTPTYVIQGHDGSITKAFNDYRDDLLLELERRIYNSTRVKYDPDIFDINDVIGGYYRRGNFTKEEINNVLLSEFLKWNNIPKMDFNTNDFFVEEESFTYNYNRSLSPNKTENLYGFWRGIYNYFFDTDRPHTHPWEIQGFYIKPQWWDDVYGSAPYTSENKIMWDAIEQGLINEPNNQFINLKYARPGLSNHIPVDSDGNLLSPLDSNLAQAFSLVNAQGRYTFGDQGPVETAWRKSSEYPFAIMILCCVLKGSEFIGKFWDRFTIKRNIAGQIYQTTTGKTLSPVDLIFSDELLNDNTYSITNGLANFIDEYVGVENYYFYYDSLNAERSNYRKYIRGLDVKLRYRLGGYSSKEKIKVLLDSRTPEASGTIFLPQENYKLFYNKSAPVETLNYSGVIIEKTINGYSVRGYDNERNYFEIFSPLVTSSDISFNVGGISESFVDWTAEKYYTRGQVVRAFTDQYYRAKISHTSSSRFDLDFMKWQKLSKLPLVGGRDAIRRKRFNSFAVKIPYGTVFNDIQSIVDFLLGYGERLKSWGFQFDDFSNDINLPLNWLTSAKEFMFWTLQNWSEGAVITLSPSANNLLFNPTITASVDNLDTEFYEYSIFKADGMPLKYDLTNIYREGNGFGVKPSEDTRDGIFFTRTNLVYKEHIILFDNVSIFNDIIYDIVPGYRQGRLKLNGFKTNNWNGGYTSPGFIYDEAVILNWDPNTDYNLGDIVQYQNYYFTATKKILSKLDFNISDGWKQLTSSPKSTLIPNFDYRIEQFRDFYSLDSTNFDSNQQELSRHLIGYQPRQYLNDIIIDDVSQYKFYQGFIKEKGTINSITKLFDALRAQNVSYIDLKEEWAVKVGDYGASEAYTEIEFPLDEQKFRFNPQDILLTQTNIEDYNSHLYTVSPDKISIKPTLYNGYPFKMFNLDTKQNDYGIFRYKVAGYVKDEDVDHIVYDEASLLNYDINLLNHKDKIWLGNTNNGDWDVLECFNTKIFIKDWNIQENIISLILSDVPTSIIKDDIILIKNLDILDGLYKVQRVYSNIIEIFTFNTAVYKETDESTVGLLFKLDSIRFTTSSEIPLKRYNNLDIRGEKLWIDSDSNNTWKVLENIDAFTESRVSGQIEKLQISGQLYGYETKLSIDQKYMFVSSVKNGKGNVSVYFRPNSTSQWVLLQIIEMPVSYSDISGNDRFGTSIDITDDNLTLAISAPYVSNVYSEIKGTFNTNTTYYPGEIVIFNNNLWKNLNTVHGDGSSITINSQDWELVTNTLYEIKGIYPGTGLSNQGVVFIFAYNFTSRTFELEQVIASYVPYNNEKFGSKVKIKSDGLDTWLFVSSKNYLSDTGRVQIFRKTDNLWQFNDQKFLDFTDIYGSYSSIYTPTVGSMYGYDIDITSNASRIAVSAPFLGSGAVYIFYRLDYRFELAQIIDSYTLSNGIVTNLVGNDSYLQEGDLFGYSLSITENHLYVTCPNDDNIGVNSGSVYYFDHIGLDSSVNPYRLKQVIIPPTIIDNERFGIRIGIDLSDNILVVSASGGNTVLDINFDNYSDRFTYEDSTLNYVLDNSSVELRGTTFDTESTTFYDIVPYTGSVYIYNRINDCFIYGDKLFPSDNLSTDDNFGFSLDIKNSVIVVGTPQHYVSGSRIGTVFIFDYTDNSWKIKESGNSLVDIVKFKKAFIYDSDKNVLIDTLDFIDPAKGKIPGPADQELKYQTYYDPAIYEFGISDEVAVNTTQPWTDEHVGQLWWDLSKVKFVWYEQGDATYRSNNWGRLFTGSSVDIYEWIETTYLPSQWAEIADTDAGLALGISGIPKDIDNFTYSTKYKYDPISGLKTTLYYYWVKNKTNVPRVNFRSLAASDVAKLILDPKSQGYKYIAITGNNSLSLTNIGKSLRFNHISLNLQFYEVDNTQLKIHREYAIIAKDDADALIPPIIENKWFDSLIGYNVKGETVPDSRLNVRQKYGSSNDPRQSWFINRFEAVKQLFEYVNSVLIKEQIADRIDFTNLNKKSFAPVIRDDKTIPGEIDLEVDVLDDLRFIGTSRIQPAKVSPIVINGQISVVIIDDPGYGYIIPPIITVSGTGTGASIKSVIDSVGRLTSVEIIKTGKDYDLYSTTITVRKFSVLIKSDSDSNGNWSVKEWDEKRSRWVRTKSQAYNVTRYWNFIDWYASGISSETGLNYEIDNVEGLYGLPAKINETVKVKNISFGSWLILRRIAETNNLDFTVDYEVIGKQNGTIKFSDKLYNLNQDVGFDTKFTFDLNLYDQTPTLELRIILESLRDNILIKDLRIEYLNLFFNSLHYSLHEQSYIDWAFKTSFLKINHNVGTLKQRITFQSDVLPSYQQFIEEAKPYKSKIREFVSSYNSEDKAREYITDFDLPFYYNNRTGSLEKVTSISEVINQYPWKSWKDNHTYEVTEIIIRDAGSNYISDPVVIISGGGGQGAKATAYVSDGKILKINVDNPGYGYITSPSIFISGGNGDIEEFRASAYAKIGNGKVRSTNIGLKYDRVSPIYTVNDFSYTDTFSGTGKVEDTTFKLTYAPDILKSKIRVSINNLEIYGSQYDIIIEEVVHDTYTALEGYIKFVDAPSSGTDNIIVQYFKNIKLFDASDRINYSYNPITGQYGKDLSQLMTGVDYGGVQITSIDFYIGGGWDVLEWDVTSWDNVLNSNDDYVTIPNEDSSREYVLPYVPTTNDVINVYMQNVTIDETFYPYVRIDEYAWDGSTIDPTGNRNRILHVVMSSFEGNGINNVIIIPPSVVMNENTLITFRKSTSDGTILPTDRFQVDTLISGGDLTYETAKGVLAEEITIDGDGFVTPDTSHAPEELVPGQIVDSLSMKVYHSPSSGGPNVLVFNFVGDGQTSTFPVAIPPYNKDGALVMVDNVAIDIVINYQYNAITLIQIDFATGEAKPFAPPVGSKVVIVSIDTAGYDIIEKTIFNGDGITNEFLTSARYDNGDISVFITIDGYAQTLDGGPMPPNLSNPFAINIPYDVVESDESYDVKGNALIRFHQVPQENAAIQVMIFKGTVQKYSQVKADYYFPPLYIAEGLDPYTYYLARVPANIGPLSSSTFVIVNKYYNSDFTNQSNLYSSDFLVAPDCKYYIFDGTTRIFFINDPRYTLNSLDYSLLNVYKNGSMLQDNTEYTFDSGNNSITISKGVLKLDDEIIIEILALADYEILDGQLIINRKNYTMENAGIIIFNSFTNHDILKYERKTYGFTTNIGYDLGQYDVTRYDLTNYAINTSGIFNLPRKVASTSSCLVNLNRVLLTPNVDYVILDNLTQVKVILPDVLQGKDFLEILTVAVPTVKESYAFEIFKDMLNRYHYKRINRETITKLSDDFNQNDTQINVVSSEYLPEPNRIKNMSGIIEIDNERIEYLVKDGDTLSQLRRSILGTGSKNSYPAGTLVRNIGIEETVPYADEEIKHVYLGDESTKTFYVDYIPQPRAGTIHDGSTSHSEWNEWYREEVEINATIPATNIISGRRYKIVSLGNTIGTNTLTDFTLVGAVSNSIGTKFWATGNAVGTGTVVAMRAVSIPYDHGQCDEIEVFVAGRRLNKTPTVKYQQALGQDSFNGTADKTFEAEFSVNGTSNTVRLTEAPKIGQQIVIIRKLGKLWQKANENNSLVNSETKIAKFLTSKQVDLPK